MCVASVSVGCDLEVVLFFGVVSGGNRESKRSCVLYETADVIMNAL